ncbi:hypothetical protein ACXEIX_002351 [Klebsiella variicola]|uniref:hypothetical protein n=1 Tax=Klebsiella pneumoniae TaxID=573 RepID=UPI00058DA10B|nr:hypothetical protein [Klebsiella pneumoniae]
MAQCDYSDIAFQISTIHGFKKLFIASGAGVDIPIDHGRYLVAVNERGDRLADKSPNGTWIIEGKFYDGFDPNIPKYKHAIEVVHPPLENK